jgi:hypothetical protein
MWGDAFILQCRSDWRIYNEILVDPSRNKNVIDSCQKLHYLQMTTEKLGKAALLKSGNKIDEVCKSHLAFVKFLRSTKKNQKIANIIGMSLVQYGEHINSLLPLATKIERLVPGINNQGVNPEYPWLDNSGVVISPTSYKFMEFSEISQPSGARLLRIINLLIINFERIY